MAISVTYGLAVRYLLPTGLLHQLSEHCQPVVAVAWDDPELCDQIEAAGATALRLPEARIDHEMRRLQRMLDAGFEHRLASPTTAISRRWRRRSQPWRSWGPTLLRQARDRLVIRRPGAEERLRSEEASTIASRTNLSEFTEWLTSNDIDAVVTLTPYHPPDQLLLWAAHQQGLPSLSAIISFDNPTTRGRLPVLSDRILVWNQANLDQMERAYPELVPSQVQITGAPQFDLHRDRSRIVDEATWRRRLGLPPDRPVILYGAGPELLLPDEASVVEAIDGAITAGRISGHPIVVLRGHPADPIDRWRDLERLDHVVVSPGWGRADGGLAWPDRDEIDLQMSTLAHASVHVSICSSMAIDGAAFDRPVITPTFAPNASRSAQRRVRALYRQEHWQPIARSGGVTAVADLTELEAALTRHLEDPSLGRAGRARLVEELLTYDDGRSSERVAAHLRALLDPT